MPEITWTRAPSDYCGNPRYVCHYLHLLTAEEREDPALIGHRYEIAVKRANRIGGRKYHNKSYGGGIVFQSYSLPETEAAIARVLAD